jgi:hypothetical protein
MKHINASFYACLLLFLCSTATIYGVVRQTEKLAVVVPADVCPLVIVTQPESPLQFENVRLLKYFDGTFGKHYKLRNVSDKRIRAYTIAIWNSDNTGDLISWHSDSTGQLLNPRQTRPSEEKTQMAKLVPLSNELRGKLDLLPPIKKIVFFTILEAEFSDGTKFDARANFRSLEEHLEKFEMAYEKGKG